MSDKTKLINNQDLKFDNILLLFGLSYIIINIVLTMQKNYKFILQSSNKNKFISFYLIIRMFLKTHF